MKYQRGLYFLVLPSVVFFCLTIGVSCLAQPADGVIPIGQVHGSVGDDVRGTAHHSPFVDSANRNSERKSVTVQGVVYARTLGRDKGEVQHGFFLQNTVASADGDDNTSDGIFVFMGRFEKFKDGYSPTIGDEIVLRGEVGEYFNQTQLSRASLVRVVRRGVDIDKEIPPFEATPPDDLEAANRYWERREGMRAQVPAGSVAISGRHSFANDAEVWVMQPTQPLARRTAVYARRAFRDTHPLDDISEQGMDNGNGYRIVLGSQALRGATSDFKAAIAPARTFDTLANEVSGPVAYSFGKYSIQIDRPARFTRGAVPALNAPPQASEREREYSIATYNVENLYDYRDDPNDACDFAGNVGCPGVKPPFDYVPSGEGEYQAHLQKLARSIVDDLHAPDILLIEEIEDQDICKVDNGDMACGATDNADGKPDTLQELALVIHKAGGPAYEAVYDRNGADARGIVCAFLYRTDRVELAKPVANDPLLGNTPQVIDFPVGFDFNKAEQNPKALNAPVGKIDDPDNESQLNGIFTRAPLVGLFRLWPQQIGTGQSTAIYAIANHFSSRPDSRVAQRREQARYLAALVTTLQKANPQARVVAGGDLNVYPRPDDPFTPAERKKPSDQLAPLYDAGLINLWDAVVKEVPESAYTYVYNGQAQTLDHLWNTPAQRADLVQVRVAHINSDWPDESDEFPNRRASDHDPVVARYRFAAGQ